MIREMKYGFVIWVALSAILISCNDSEQNLILSEGERYLSAKEFQNASESYTKAIGRYPKLSEAYYGRSQASYQLSNYTSALEDINRAIELDSSLSNYYVHRGTVYEMMLKHIKAVEDYKKAIKLDNNPYAYNCIGSVLADSSKNKEAGLFYSIAISLKEDPIFYNNRGLSYEMLGQSDSAVVNYNRAIEMDSYNPDYYYNRAISKYRLDDVQGSLTDFTKAIEIDSLHDQSYYYRALIYFEKGNNDQAIQDLKIASKLGNPFAQKKLKEAN